MHPLLPLILLVSLRGYTVTATIDVQRCVVEGTVEFTTDSTRTVLWLYPNRLSVPHPSMDDRNRLRFYPTQFVPGGTILHAPKGLSITYGRLQWMPRVLTAVSTPRPGTTVSLRFTTRVPARYGPLSCMDGTMVLGAPWYPVPVERDLGGVILRKPRWFRHSVTIKGPGALFVYGRFGRSALTVSGTAPFFPAVAATSLPTKTRGRFTIVGGSSSRLLAHVREIQRLLPPEVPESQHFWVVQAPLREELAMALPGHVILVGDRAFMTLRWGPFRLLHSREIARALTEAHFIDLLGGRERGWVASMLSYALVDTSDEFERLLRKVEFLPQIDDILNAPAMDYLPAYAKGPEIPDLKRDDYRRWNNMEPRGSRVWGKLQDLLGRSRALARIHEYVDLLTKGDFVPFREMVRIDVPRDFWRTWLGPYPKVDYAIEGVSHDGRSVAVKIRRSGARITEPVDVLIEQQDGKSWHIKWMGEGEAATIYYRSGSPPSHVTVDPDGRLVEASTLPLKSPKWNNEWPEPRLRFIYTGVSALFNVTELLSNLYVSGAFFTEYDYSRRLELTAFRNDIIDGALSLTRQYFFGPLVLPHRPLFRWSVGGTLGASRSLDEGETRKIYSSVYTSLYWNSMTNGTWPTEGTWGRVSVGMRIFLDPQSPEVVTPLHYYGVAFGGAVGLPWGMSLSYYVNGAHLIGRIRYDVEYLRLGGPTLLRGYGVRFFEGKSRIFAGMEIRHHLLDDLSLSLFDLVYVPRISGAIFAGAGAGRSSAWKYGASVGYSLRFHLLWAGLYETVLEAHLDRGLYHPDLPYAFYISLTSLYR